MHQALHRIVFKAALLLLAAPAVAQIKVDPAAPGRHRATVLSTANGLPLVNIQTPSAAGVSLNRFGQFDVGPNGAILNNSRTDANTQIGGWVGGNPWLAKGPARVIVNQVNSHNPSHLNGPIEVAGQRAEVVVANPAGIRVDGGRFINALGVTLSTGTPTFNNGELEAFRVTEGLVSIEGLGLDLGAADHARILARAVAINAGLWAEHLTVVTGSNEVRALASGGDAQATPIAGTGPAPNFMLDVAAIGGMYARHIFLLGTDRGLGVNLGGALAARQTLQLLTEGRLVNKGGLSSEGDLGVRAAGVDNAAGAHIAARLGVSIETPGAVNNAGLIDGATTRLQADSVKNTGRLYGDGVSVTAHALSNEAGGVIAAREELDIAVKDTLSNRDDGLLLSAGDMVLTADRLENRSARIEALGDLDIHARTLINANEHVQVELINDGGASTTRTLYFTPAGEVEASDIAWMAVKPQREHNGDEYVKHGRSWILTRASADALGVSDPRFSAWYHGPEPYVAAGMVIVGSGDSEGQAWQEAQFSYGRDDPIWAALGLAAPEREITGDFPGPTPREKDFEQGGGGAIDQNRYRAALTEWRAKAQPWIDLGEKLAALRALINAELRPFDVYQTVTETLPTLRTTHSEPGQILAGGDARLQIGERFTNQDSEVVVGGTLHTTGAAVSNQATEFSADISRQGTAYVYGVTGRNCDLFDCEPTYGWVASAIDQRFPVQLKLQALRQAQGAADAPTAPSVDIQRRAFTVAPSTLNSIFSSALFKPATDPKRTYLIETDPRFTDRRQWLSSDHQLVLLGVDPALAPKRLGDGFIEQRLVREQIAQLTGLRFLGDFRDDEAQYSALLETGATFAQAQQLRPGIGLSAEQVAALTSDLIWLETQELTLPDGRRETVLVPRLYLRPREGDLSSQGALIAAQRVEMDLQGQFINSGQVLGRELVQIDAQGIRSPGRIGSEGSTVLQAQQDIEVEGGDVRAKDVLVLDAGRDLHVAGTTAVSTDGRAQVLQRVARLHVSDEAGLLIARAGQDIGLMAAAVQAGVVDMHAERDLRLGTVDTREALDATRDERNHGRVQRSAEVGSAIGGDSITLSAGRDVQMRAAQVQANGDLAKETPYYGRQDNGRLSVHAGRDLDILAGEASYQVEHGLYAKSSGVLGSSSTETHSLDSHTRAQGSALGGRNVELRAGKDITVKGSQAIADEDLDVQAGGDVRVLAERTEHRQESLREEKTSGLYGSGAGLTLGRQQHSSEQQSSGTGAAASTLGAIQGNVNIHAGQTYEQLGSDVLAPEGDIDVRAKDIRITEARTSEQRWQEEKMSQSGLTLGVGGAAVQAMQAFAGTAEAIGHTDDKRMQALGVAAAGLQIQQSMDAVAEARGQGDATGGVSVNISIGASSSRSTSEGSADSAQGSRVSAGGKLTFIAEGAGEDSDVLVRGSDIHAGKTVRLKAEGDVELRAAQNTARERTDSKNSSGSVGIGFQLGGTGAGFGITASASAGKGHAEGESMTHTNTHVRAGEKVFVESDGNTTLTGAVLSADRFEADIRGDLLIESLQDRLAYKERSQQAGGSVTFGVGVAGGSFSAGATNIDSEYASVAEQSGMRAGDGGFDIQVKGKTTLKGGAITSTQAAVDAGQNHLDSQVGLELQDVRNQASYQAKSSGVTVGAGNQLSSSGAGIGSDDDQASSTTQASISGIAGRKDARTGDGESGIAPIFDKEKIKDEVEAQVVITTAFGQQAVPAAASYADKKAVALRREGKEEEARKWDEGGEYRVGLHAAIGLLTGGIEGAVGAGAGAALVPVAGEAIADLNLPEPVRQALTQVAGLGMGAVAGKAGAAASLNQTAHNYVSHSPYREVNRRVSQENARLTRQCDDSCTAEYFRYVDAQMAKLEAAATLGEQAKRGQLSQQEAKRLAQFVVELAPFYGSGESLAQLISGQSSITGEEVSRFWAAVGVVPIAGGVLKRVGEPAVDALAAIFKGGEAIKTVGAAADLERGVNVAQAAQLRAELNDWAKITPDLSRDAEYIAKTDANVLRQNNFDMNHVLAGEINASGRATGYHAEFAADGAARIKPGAEITYNANGTYEAPVQVWDASTSQWIDKKNVSTFFPPSWSQARIEYEMSEAFKKGSPGTGFGATSPSGIQIQFRWDAKNQRTTFYPMGKP